MPKENIDAIIHKRIATAKKVICLNTMQIFNCSEDAGKWINRNNGSSIASCCRGEQLTSGTHPTTGEKLRWMYYKDYLESTAS